MVDEFRYILTGSIGISKYAWQTKRVKINVNDEKLLENEKIRFIFQKFLCFTIIKTNGHKQKNFFGFYAKYILTKCLFHVIICIHSCA